MKMLVAKQEDQDGNMRTMLPSPREDRQTGHRARLDYDGSGGEPNALEAVKQEDGGESGVRVSGVAFSEPQSEKCEPLKSGAPEKIRNDDLKDERRRSLQYAVSQGVRQAQLHHQKQQQSQLRQQASVIRWERFLPQHQLRVLLVEDDDSTRHVVSALLRNCSYEVTSAANGLEAWELLMDETSQVDLVLTEVVMPCLSGIGLLTRMLNHEPLKHIPVIMMSSHDSMGIVFKCLSKGAVDFLVKPVRKNELKNLWQHIWRRCHSSSGSGSGSGSGSQTHKVLQPGGAAEANNSVSNDESENTSSELNIGGGSDNGSGTQSSWTKKAVEVESSPKGFYSGLMLQSQIQTKNGCMSGADHQKGKDVDILLDATLVDSRAVAADQAHVQDEKGQSESVCGMVGAKSVNARDNRFVDEGFDIVFSSGNAQREPKLISEDPSKGQESAEEQQADSEDADALLEKHASNSSNSKEKTLHDSSSPPLLKLSLKRPCQADDDGEEDSRGLKYSCSSAFSRYNNSGNHIPLPAGTISAKAVGFAEHPFVHGSSVGSSHPSSIHFSSGPFSKGGSNEVMASPFFRGPVRASRSQDRSPFHMFPSNLADSFAKEKVTMGSGIQKHLPVSPGTPNACKEPVTSDHPVTPNCGPTSKNDEAQEFYVSFRPSEGHQNSHINQDAQFHHHSHHHHHHHHHIQHHYHHHGQDHLQQIPLTPKQEDSTVLNSGSAPKCGSSNMKGKEVNNGQSGSSNGYGSNGHGAVSLNGSATGSNNGSNGGQSVAAEPGCGGNGDSGAQQVGAGNGLVNAPSVLLGRDQSRHARREAALTKFRQKRKERCFEKKVRYQSRKRLAEQRPRVRGQFVRQSVQKECEHGH